MTRKGENIFKRKDGRFEARFIKDYKDGEPNYSYVYGKTYLEAKEKRRFVVSKIESATTVNKNLFSFYLNDWLFNKKDKIKKSSYMVYENKIRRYLRPELGSKMISQLSKELLEDYLNNKLLFLDTNTVHELGTIIKSIFKEYNININFEVPLRKKKSIDVFLPSEVKTIEIHSLAEENPITLGILISLYTGLRIGEVCALKKENFDLSNKIIYINHTLIRVKSDNFFRKTKVVMEDPKTISSNRIVPIANKLYEPLEKYLNSIHSDNYFFLTGTTHCMEPRVFYNKYIKLLNRWGIKKHKYHALRHTFATQAVEKNMDVKALSEVLGHSNVAITLNLYVHPSLDYKKDCIDRIFN